MPFPGIAFAVSPAPESGTENTQIVESDSTPAETSSSVQAATSDSTPAATPNNVQAAAPDNIQSTVPESTQTAAPDNAQAQSSDSAPAATSDGAPAETSGGTQAAAPDSAPAETSDGTQAEATDKETLPLLIIVAGFSNVSYRDDFDWAEAIFNGDESLAAYYKDMSLGQFTFVPMNETCSHESGDRLMGIHRGRKKHSDGSERGVQVSARMAGFDYRYLQRIPLDQSAGLLGSAK